MFQSMERAKVVHVRAYERVRLHRKERVRSHWRSMPEQLKLPFVF